MHGAMMVRPPHLLALQRRRVWWCSAVRLGACRGSVDKGSNDGAQSERLGLRQAFGGPFMSRQGSNSAGFCPQALQVPLIVAKAWMAAVRRSCHTTNTARYSPAAAAATACALACPRRLGFQQLMWICSCKLY